jgi:glycosyltransferase involved in cell wall biosynthesis
VITSSTASLPEIAGDAALIVDPYSVESIRKALVAVEADEDLRRDLGDRGRKRAEQFTTSAYRQRLSALYKDLKI